MSPGPEQEPQNITAEFPYSDAAIVTANRIVSSAFRHWVETSDFDERRVQDLLNADEESPRSKLHGNERNRVVRQAAIAIEQAYANIENMDQLDTIRG